MANDTGTYLWTFLFWSVNTSISKNFQCNKDIYIYMYSIYIYIFSILKILIVIFKDQSKVECPILLYFCLTVMYNMCCI